MALMLRKAAAPVLQAADLDPYHADLDRITKEFKLYTPCGKTFAIVSGVLFSSLSPTKDEIAYAVELLEFWLLRNKTIIDTYITAFTKLQMYGDLDTTRDDMTIVTTRKYDHTQNKQVESLTVHVKHNDLSFYINSDGLFTGISWNGAIPPTTAIKLPAAKLTAAIAFLDEHLDQRAAKTTVDEILAEMNTCKDM